MLLPCFLRFPTSANLPVGFVMNPYKMTGAKFRDAINYLAGRTDRRNTGSNIHSSTFGLKLSPPILMLS
jgi:hypothetical protein